MERTEGEYCIVHCRVSSTKQSQEGESLSVQAGICVDIASSRRWPLAHEPWLESFSGRKSNRPVFAEVLDFLDANPGKVRRYLFRSIDRFTRGGTYTYEMMKRELAKRGVEMVDSYGIIQPSKNTLEDLGIEYDWSKYYPSEITESVMATTAKARHVSL
jgi:DNA invertase Pin-like site-specific DNA recombinase